MRSLVPVLLLLALALPLFADSAEVQLFVEPTNVNQLTLDVRVINYGPDVARNVVLAIDMPEGLTFERIAGYQCDTSANPIRCTLGDLPVDNSGVFFHIELKRPGTGDGTYAVILTVSSDTPDPELTLNTRRATITMQVLADLNVQMFPPLARLDPGATQVFRTEIRNYYVTVPPADIRVEYTLTNGTIVALTPPAGVTCTLTSDTTALCTAPSLEEHCFCLPPTEVTVKTSDDRNGGAATLTAHASSNLQENYEGNDQATGTAQTYRWLVVDNTNDSGAGSLRDTIAQANAECGAAPCKIAFEIKEPVPGTGWFTITPETPLPAITADRVVLTGATQTAFSGDTNPAGPEVAIDGRLAHSGLVAQSRCESVVEGLALGHFDANQALWFMHPLPFCTDATLVDRHLVQDNFIGVDPSGAPWPNLRGLRADGAIGTATRNVISDNTYSGVWMWKGALTFEHNVITRNGASGILIGPEANANIFANTISFNAQMGVAAARSRTLVDIRQNAMKDNGGLGIDWGLDGVSPVDGDDREAPSNAPVLTSAIYRDGKTYVTFTIKTGPLGPYFNQYQLDFYVNDSPDADGEHWVFANTIFATNTAEIEGDHRGKWINATSTRTHFFAAKPPRISSQSIAGGDSTTSELSNAVLVQ